MVWFFFHTDANAVDKNPAPQSLQFKQVRIRWGKECWIWRRRSGGQWFPVSLLLPTSIHYCGGLEGADGILMWLEILQPEYEPGSEQGGAYNGYNTFSQVANCCVGSYNGGSQSRVREFGEKRQNTLKLLFTVNLLMSARNLLRCVLWGKTILKVKAWQNWLNKQVKPGAMWGKKKNQVS